MDHCVVEAVTHKHDLLANASLGRTAFFFSPLAHTLPSCSHRNCIHIELPDILHLKLPYWYGQPDQNAKITSYFHC